MKEEGEDNSIEELDKEQRDVEVFDENLERMLEETINKKALKIGRKVLDEIYFHGEDEIQVSIRKSKLFDWSVVDVGIHKITGLLEDEIKFISDANLTEKNLNYFEIKRKISQ